eukprot:TRINITY_DN1638_c2_g1_i2.p1 TRINITY_DN1638_c2_g1~~TRINITY_DN1638_c2_g1_i2.p1  ORF type:complete len:418 (+),score=35.88 TRINITY_DN1638_c2_g1_i2:1-1254(+)
METSHTSANSCSNGFEKLNSVLIVDILSRLSIQDLVSCLQICKTLASYSRNERLWRCVCQRQFEVIGAPFLEDFDSKKYNETSNDPDSGYFNRSYWHAPWNSLQLDKLMMTLQLPEHLGWTHWPWHWLAACLLTNVDEQPGAYVSKFNSYQSFAAPSPSSPHTKPPMTTDQDPKPMRCGFDVEPHKLLLGDFNEGDYLSGKGVRFYRDFGFHCGDFVDGEPSGKGVKIYAGGYLYEGEFYEGEFQGKGVFRYPEGSIYEGEFRNGSRQGYGVHLFSDGGVHEGQFHNDNRQGKGVYRFPDGAVYEGEFYYGVFQGKGVHRNSDGDVYEGEFDDDKLHGKGVHRNSDGDVYEGEFHNGKYQGEGVLRFSDGRVHEGQFKDGEFQGKEMILGHTGNEKTQMETGREGEQESSDNSSVLE